MMYLLALLMGVLLPILLAAAYLLGRHSYRGQKIPQELSPVSRQHIDLFQGGQLSEVALESTKRRFQEMLEHGDVAAVEASLRPGTQYVVQVRALAEIGTDEAAQILERQLQRRLSTDLFEQSWYWIDLANGLRTLNRQQSLPDLLRCAEAGVDQPLSHFLAAETVCFLSFAGYMRDPESRLGRTALRVLHRALEGLRSGVQPQVVSEARLGELIEDLWEHRPERTSPLAVRVFAEALRMLQRAPHAEVVLGDDGYEQEAFTWQMSRLASLEPALTDYLEEAAVHFRAQLPTASSAEQAEILGALEDIRGESAPAVLALLVNPTFAHAELAVGTLKWSRDSAVGPFLRAWACRQVPILQRGRQRRRLVDPPRKPSIETTLPYGAILRALRGHAAQETEELLIQAAHDFDPTYRAAAVSSLGWWPPYMPERVENCLRDTRRDPNPEVRLFARAALARLGECQSLNWFRHALSSQETMRVHEAIQTIAQEGVLFLWPDLDHLAESENTEIALHACEALERMREELILKKT